MPRVTKYDENDEPIAGYRLVSFLGAGQFGEVWKANEVTTRKLVAIKIIDLSHSSSALKELKALNLVINLNHPNLIPIFTARLKDKNGREIPLHKTDELKQKGALRELVIAMGLGDKSLSARLKELNPDGTDPAEFKGLPVDELLGYMQGAARGLDFLNKADHGQGVADGPIVHCDIKPDNMMIVSGEVQIADCGVAVIITPDVRQTKAAGSPAYSAPELTGNKPVPGTDQYALAISYFEMRTGRLPFDEHMGQLQIMLAHAEGRLDFDSHYLCEEEVQVLKWATAVRPKERYATCLDMVKQLERAIEGLPPMAPSQIGVKSGVVQVPLKRQSTQSASPFDPASVRSTPNLPKSPSRDSNPKFDSAVSFDQPEPDGIRETVIPDSDRYLPPKDSGFNLPLPSARGDASQSDIVMPMGDENLFADVDSDEPPTPPSPYTAPRPLVPGGGEQPSTSRTNEISRPQIAIDGDDPMGARAGTVELDPEIAKIIKGTAPPKQPAMRLPTSAPAVQTQRPPSRPEIAPAVETGRRATEIPRETPAEKAKPDWAVEAERAEADRTRKNSAPSIATTNWKEPETAKAGGGLGVKLIAGGVLLAGLAGGGAYFGGLLGKGGNSSGPPKEDAKKTETDTKTDSNTGNGSGTGTGTTTVPTKVDPTLIAAIEQQLGFKPSDNLKAAQVKLDSAQTKIDALPKDAVYDADRVRLKSELAKVLQAFDEAVGTEVNAIDTIVKSVDPKADPVVAKTKTDEAERRIADALPSRLPDRFKATEGTWSGAIAGHKAAMKLNTEDLKFLSVLAELEKRPLSTFSEQLKIVYDAYKLELERQKAIGKKLIEIGTKREELRESIVAFLTEDLARFKLLYTEDADRTPIFTWRTKPVKDVAEKLLAKFELLTTGTSQKTIFDEIEAMRDDLSTRRKTVGIPFGEFWNDKYLDTEVAKANRLATDWIDAQRDRGNGIMALREYVHGTPAELVLPMTMEYLRIGTGRSESVANLRKARDASAKSEHLKAADRAKIDQMFQGALAIEVSKKLATASATGAAKDKPDWKEIVETICGPDEAFGWKAAAQAEWDFDKSASLGSLAAAETVRPEDATAADRKAFVSYLKAIAKRDAAAADELAGLTAAPSPILSLSYRTQRIAALLAEKAIVGGATSAPSVEAILDGKGNPYTANAKALAWLKRADELDGKNHREWAIHLYFLANASNDATAAKQASARVSLDEAKLAKTNDLAIALTYYRSRALDPANDRSSQVEAYATAARLAHRLMEATLDPKDDVVKREGTILALVAAFAKKGSDLSAGSNADRLSLDLAAFRNDFFVYKLSPATLRTTIDSIARGLPRNHPDYADARALRSYSTMYRFHFRDGDLIKDKAEETERKSEWQRMQSDAEDAIAADPANGIAHRVLSTTLAGTYKGMATAYPPPESLKSNEYVANLATTLKTAKHFKAAADALKARQLASFWRVRAVYLFDAANVLAKFGAAPTDVRTLLDDAATSARKSYDQRTDKPIDDIAQVGISQEDLAWLGQERPPETYKAALQSFEEAAERPRTNPIQRNIGVRIRVDTGRTIVRAVMFDHFPTSRLADADRAFEAIKTEIDKLPEAERDLPGMKKLLAEGVYWKAHGLLAARNYDEAQKEFDAATEANRLLNGGLSTLSLAHRAEAILAGSMTRDGAKTVIDDCAKGIEEKIRIDVNGILIRSMFFVPDYLKARNALADKDTALAKKHFEDAYRAIDSARSRKTLEVEDAFALRCLAYELANVNLAARDRDDRKKLLADLEKAFAWSMTPADKKLVADALK